MFDLLNTERTIISRSSVFSTIWFFSQDISHELGVLRAEFAIMSIYVNRS